MVKKNVLCKGWKSETRSHFSEIKWNESRREHKVQGTQLFRAHTSSPYDVNVVNYNLCMPRSYAFSSFFCFVSDQVQSESSRDDYSLQWCLTNLSLCLSLCINMWTVAVIWQLSNCDCHWSVCVRVCHYTCERTIMCLPVCMPVHVCR